MDRNLGAFFDPQSIAIIGASETATKVGSVVLQNIITSGYKGKIFPINSHLTQVGGLKFYAEVSQLPQIPDLVVIAIPASGVNQELEQCAQFGVKNFVIFSSGFKEVGYDGEKLEKELLNISQKYQLNILGPNCLGFALPNLNVTFSNHPQTKGNLKIISQSGAIISSLFQKNNFHSCISLGNKTVLNENDFLQFWSSNPSPIGLYLESISHGVDFIKLISQFTPQHPIFILKPGKSSSAVTAMKSHTGSIATSDFVLDAAFRQSGVIRCETLPDFFTISQIISDQKIPSGPNVAVITNAGGPGVLATDAIIKSGLKMAKLSSSNPYDLLGDATPEQFKQALETVLASPNVDSIIVIVTPQKMTNISQISQVINDFSQKSPVPIFTSFIPDSFPDSIITALGSLWQWQQWRQNQSLPISVNLPHDQIAQAISQSLPNQLPQNLLSSLSISTPATAFISNVDQATEFVKKNNYPVVLKVSSEKILHKTDIGGVILNINNDLKLLSAFNQLISLSPTLQIQTQIETGVEIIVGFKRDPTFGPIILFGAGGKFAEIFADRNISILPLNSVSMNKLVTQSQVAKLLSGFRGDSAYNLDALYKTLQLLSQLFLDFPQISEMEINPLIVNHHGVVALDPKLIMN